MTEGWKKWFWRSAGFGFGITTALALSIGVWIWYSSRPKPPKPWNTKAIVATYYRAIEIEDRKLRFEYVLENTTDADFRIEEYEKPSLAARLEDPDSLTGFGSENFKIRLPVYVPTKQKSIVYIEMPDYGFKGGPLSSSATPEEKKTQRLAVATHITENMSNLNGFVLFDESARYEIDFPKGWKDEKK